MTTNIRSLHHVTATVSDAQEDLDCYGATLGLRLVKKTVNFDNHNVYHFYYGDENGTPGTLMTTFPYKGWGVRSGVHGAGQITVTSFSVPEGSMGFWAGRLHDRGFEPSEIGSRFGNEQLTFVDPSGLVIELVADDDDHRTPWVADGIGEDSAIRGVSGVTLLVRDAPASIEFLTGALGWEVSERDGDRTRLAVNGDLPGHRLEVQQARDAPNAVNGTGTVHHVAMAVSDDAAQRRLRDELVRRGVQVTPVLDRQYFRSIYFREPGGVLYEAATIGPGFAIDEDVSNLGRDLKLPEWEELNRAAIQKGLAEVSY